MRTVRSLALRGSTNHTFAKIVPLPSQRQKHGEAMADFLGAPLPFTLSLSARSLIGGALLEFSCAQLPLAPCMSCRTLQGGALVKMSHTVMHPLALLSTCTSKGGAFAMLHALCLLRASLLQLLTHTCVWRHAHSHITARTLSAPTPAWLVLGTLSRRLQLRGPRFQVLVPR